MLVDDELRSKPGQVQLGEDLPIVTLGINVEDIDRVNPFPSQEIRQAHSLDLHFTDVGLEDPVMVGENMIPIE